MTPALAPQNQSWNGGVVDDWTQHHVIFTNPGTLEEAFRKGAYQDWQRIVTDPRYQMQQARRYGASAGQMTTPTSGLPEALEADPPAPEFENRFPRIKREPPWREPPRLEPFWRELRSAPPTS
jgi:hypothetical protein